MKNDPISHGTNCELCTSILVKIASLQRPFCYHSLKFNIGDFEDFKFLYFVGVLC